MNAQTKFIVWDWNGTLLDDTDMVLSCINAVLARVDAQPVTIDEFRDWQMRPLEKFYRHLGLDENQVALALEHECSLFHDTYEPLAARASLRDGAAAMLEFAGGNALSSLILSNHLTGPIRAQLERHVIHHHFAEVLAYADRATQYKDMTKGERLRRFMETRSLDPRNAIIVGDAVEEIDIARAHGLVSVAITGGVASEARLHAAKPDHLIHALPELKPILQERGFAS